MRLLTDAYSFNSIRLHTSPQRGPTPGRSSRGVRKHLSGPAPIWVVFHKVRSCPRPRTRWAAYCGFPAGALRRPSVGPVLLHRHPQWALSWPTALCGSPAPGGRESARLFAIGVILDPLLVGSFSHFSQQVLGKRAQRGGSKVVKCSGPVRPVRPVLFLLEVSL